MNCRHCRSPLTRPLVDLGAAPPSNAYLTAAALRRPERWFPLRVLVCERCWLVQTEDFAEAHELFDDDYAYFSGVSASWLDHARRYVDSAASRFGLGSGSHVVEVASNDGYLLQYVQARGIPCTGVEPTASTAAAARAKGITVVSEFFGRSLAERLAAEGRAADRAVANNVVAHGPDINDFAAGFASILKPDGVATFEFPHLMNLLAEVQFDTIYHEHYSYLSLGAVRRVFHAAGLAVFDVERLPTHGGSLRVYAQRTETGTRPVMPAVEAVIALEGAAGLERGETYDGFQEKVERIRDDLLLFLIEAKRSGRTVVAYGAAAKGNTLLNFAGVRPDLLPLVVDRNPSKQGKFMPGSRIPIRGPEAIERDCFDYLLVLPWNIIDEVRHQLRHVRERGTRLVVAVPRLTVQ